MQWSGGVVSIQSNLRMTISLTSSYHLQMTVSLLPLLLEILTHTQQEVLQHVLPGSSSASKLITMYHAFSGNTF